MKVQSIIVSIFLLLLIACSPAEPEQSENDISTVNKVHELNDNKNFDEAALEKEQQAELALREKSLQVLIDNDMRVSEAALLDSAKNLQKQTEAALLKLQVAEQHLSEQALLESARNNADQLQDSLNE